ncbi:MAG: ISNCY family transposase [bacterium]|nr:ISNCY family transposase [bacterium]
MKGKVETFNMSRREIGQINVFEKLKEKQMKQHEAAKILNLSTRQIRRKLKSYRLSGEISLVNKSRGKPSNHRFADEFWTEIITLVKDKYADFGPTFASEKLQENHHILVNHESLRLKMINESLWTFKKRKAQARQMRERKECYGELVQLDGSVHAWFENKASKCTLIAFIDDATSRIVYLEFTTGETTENLMRTTRTYLETHGKPAAFYMDRGGVYKVNLNNPNDDKLTQYGRALEELDIAPIYARSPQAKGRVERLFGTLQDRLVKELRLKGISSIEEANKYLNEQYIALHNARFAEEPQSKTNLHQSIEGYDLNSIFCIKEERKINHDYTTAYKTRWLQLLPKQPTILYPKETVEVWQHLDGTITIHQGKSTLNFKEIAQRPQKLIIVKRKEKENPQIPWTPKANHPWKKFVIVHQKRDISKLLKADITILR